MRCLILNGGVIVDLVYFDFLSASLPSARRVKSIARRLLIKRKDSTYHRWHLSLSIKSDTHAMQDSLGYTVCVPSGCGEGQSKPLA